MTPHPFPTIHPPLDLEPIRVLYPDWDVEWHESLDSTNNECIRRSRDGGTTRPLLLLAGAQTAGRGREGRPWQSPPNVSFLGSAMLPGTPTGESLTLWPIRIGVAMAGMLESVFAVPVSLKWPNDLLSNCCKLGGILVERLASGALVAGVGININQLENQLPPRNPGVPPASSIRLARRPPQGADVEALDYHLSVMILGTALLRALADPLPGALVRVGFLKRWSGLGRPVLLSSGNPAAARDLDEDGYLLAEDAAGDLHRISNPAEGPAEC